MVGSLSWLVPRWARTCVRTAALPGGHSPSEVPGHHLPHKPGRPVPLHRQRVLVVPLAAGAQTSQVPECGSHGTLAADKQKPWPSGELWASVISRALIEGQEPLCRPSVWSSTREEWDAEHKDGRHICTQLLSAVCEHAGITQPDSCLWTGGMSKGSKKALPGQRFSPSSGRLGNQTGKG